MSSSKSRMAIRILAVLLCAGGIWVSHHLALLHVLSLEQKTAAKKEKAILDQACTALLSQGDCEQVVASEWGTIYFGGAAIPTALVGLDYFIILLCWFVLVGEVPRSRLWVHLIVACLMAAGLGMSVFLLYQMSHLPKPCPLCIVTHVINFLLFGCILLLWPRERKAALPATEPAVPTGATGDSLFAPSTTNAGVQFRDGPGWSMLVLTPIVALLGISVVTLSLKVRAQSATNLSGALVGGAKVPKQIQQIEQFAEKTHNQELRELTKQLTGLHHEAALKLKKSEDARDYYKKMFERFDSKWEHTFTGWKISPELVIVTEGRPARGVSNAQHTVVVYSDFQCPTCRDFETMYSEKILPLSSRYKGLKVVFKNWPICTDCNPNAKRNLHPAACKAALAAEAAFMVGGNDAFWRMHDLLFATQATWSDKDKWKDFDFGTYAQQISVDVEQFKKAMNGEEAMRRVKADLVEGYNLGKDLLATGKIKDMDQEAVRVDSTPSVYIDNKKLPKWNNLRAWQEVMRPPAPPRAGSPSPAASSPTTSPN